MKRYFCVDIVKDKPPIVHVLFLVRADSKVKAIQMARDEAKGLDGKELTVFTKQVQDIHPATYLTTVSQQEKVPVSPDL